MKTSALTAAVVGVPTGTASVSVVGSTVRVTVVGLLMAVVGLLSESVLLDLAVAVILTACTATTPLVVMGNTLLVSFAANVTVAGTTTFSDVETSETVNPS